ncbi:hypothetical protein CIB48_g6916 [Xylaria polymorpha]|nr:hypothetical protein CIB48_g6916 [Xylaria polymorpha]
MSKSSWAVKVVHYHNSVLYGYETLKFPHSRISVLAAHTHDPVNPDESNVKTKINHRFIHTYRSSPITPQDKRDQEERIYELPRDLRIVNKLVFDH